MKRLEICAKMKNENNLSIKNLASNLTMVQKLGVGFGFIIIILLIVLATLAIADRGNGGEGEVAEGEIVKETYEEDGYTVTTETYTNEEGEIIVTGEKEDEWGNITTLDPGLVTTYFPYQVAREHDGYDSTLRYYLSIDEENDKVIRAMIEYCDVEGDMVLVQQYVNSIPLDMSGYTIEYQTFSTDSDCGD